MQKNPPKWWEPWHMVLIWEYSARAFQLIPTWQGLDVFQKSLRPCAFDESSLSTTRVNLLMLLESFFFWILQVYFFLGGGGMGGKWIVESTCSAWHVIGHWQQLYAGWSTLMFDFRDWEASLSAPLTTGMYMVNVGKHPHVACDMLLLHPDTIPSTYYR